MVDWLSLLLIVYCCYFFVLLFFTNAKVLNPTFVYTVSFFIAIGLAFVFEKELHFNLSKETFWLITIAGAIMIFVELFYIIIYGEGNKKVSAFSPQKAEPIIIEESFVNLVLLLSLVFVILSVTSLLLSTGSGSFSNRMFIYKNQLITNASSLKFHFIVAQIFKILTAIIYVMTYIWAFNYSKAKTKIFLGLKEIVIILLFVVGTFIAQGARQPAFEYILYFIFVYLSLNLKGVKKNEILKIVLRSIPVIPMLGVVYYYTMTLAGRSQSPRKMLEYIGANYSGGLYYLDSVIDRPACTDYFGQFSFNLVYQFLSKIGIVNKNEYIAVHPNGRYGNTLTLFGRWYEDFGDIGVYLMTFFVALFFCHLYYSKVYKKTSNQHIYRIFYCKLLMIMVWAGYDDGVRPYLSVGGVVTLLLLYFFYLLLIEKKSKLK